MPALVPVPSSCLTLATLPPLWPASSTVRSTQGPFDYLRLCSDLNLRVLECGRYSDYWPSQAPNYCLQQSFHSAAAELRRRRLPLLELARVAATGDVHVAGGETVASLRVGRAAGAGERRHAAMAA